MTSPRLISTRGCKVVAVEGLLGMFCRILPQSRQLLHLLRNSISWACLSPAKAKLQSYVCVFCVLCVCVSVYYLAREHRRAHA